MHAVRLGSVTDFTLLICCYMFRSNCHPQGAYTNAVKTYSNEVVLQ